MLGERVLDSESDNLGKNPISVAHQSFGSGSSQGLAWEIEALASTVSTSLLQANSNKSKIEVKIQGPCKLSSKRNTYKGKEEFIIMAQAPQA